MFDVSEVKLLSAKRGFHIASIAGSGEVYVFEDGERNCERGVVLVAYLRGVDAFQVIGGLFSRIESPHATVEALRNMGFDLALLPRRVQKALAIHAVL